MKIYRIINGCDPEAITLTPSELRQAYLEAQKEYDLEDVSQNFPHSELVDSYDWLDGIELISEKAWDEDGIPRVAQKYREYVDDSDNWFRCLQDAVEYVAREMIADKK